MAEPDDDIIIEDIPQQRRNSFSFRRGENRNLDEAMNTFRREAGNRRPEEPQPEEPQREPQQEVHREEPRREPQPEEPQQEVHQGEPQREPQAVNPNIQDPQVQPNILNPQVQDPNVKVPDQQARNPEVQNPNLQVKNPEVQPQAVNPEAQNPNPQVKNPEVQPQAVNPEVQNPNLQVQNPEVQPQAVNPENDQERRRREEREAEQQARNLFNQQQDRQRRAVAEAENQPAANAKPDVQKKNEEKVQQPEKDAKKENPFKGTVDAQEMKDGTFLQTQSDRIRTLRYLTREVTFGSRRGFSSREFRKIKQDLFKLDKFMRTVNGRTSLKKAEMEEYERLTMNVRESTEVYLKKKRASLMRKAGADGKVRITKYQQKRLLAIKELQNEVDALRHDMYDPVVQNQKEELQKKCNEKINDMKETLDGLYQTEAKNRNLKPALEGAVHQTLFYLDRMDSLSKSFRMKPGESFQKTKERLNKDLQPSEQDLQRIAHHDLTKSIVDAGMKAIQKGKPFSLDDIKRLKAEYIRKNARRYMERRDRLAAPQEPEAQNRLQNDRVQPENQLANNKQAEQRKKAEPKKQAEQGKKAEPERRERNSVRNQVRQPLQPEQNPRRMSHVVAPRHKGLQ